MHPFGLSSSNGASQLKTSDWKVRLAETSFPNGMSVRICCAFNSFRRNTMLNQLRNIGISAHIDSGKTTLAERVLFYSGRIHVIRDVRGGDGGATMDSDPIEKDRGITIASAATRVHWDGHPINIIDTPGHVDFTVEVERSLRVLDGAIMVVCAAGGVQSQTVTVDRQMRRYEVPRIAFINKMDLLGAEPDRVVAEMLERLDINAVPIQIPLGSGADFQGVIDLIAMQAVYFDGDNGERVRRESIPESHQAAAENARASMIEALSWLDESMMDLHASGRVPDELEIQHAIRKATLESNLTPVMFGSAFKNVGVQEVLDAVVRYLPSPNERQVVVRVQADDDSEMATVELRADPELPTVAMAFKTVVSDFGQLTYLRVYQGQLTKGETYRSAHSGRKVRFGRLVRMHADKLEDISHAEAGDIVAVVGVDCVTGDTFLGSGASCVLEGIHVADPVMSLAIVPKQRDHQEKLAKALDRFRREDPTFRVSSDPKTGQTLISGMGRLHLDVILEKIETEFGCPCDVGVPQVAYKQRPTVSVDFDYKFNKQTGGPGQYGHIIGSMTPLPEDADEPFEFRSEVVRGNIPSEFISSIEKGLRSELVRGPLGKFEVVGVSVVVRDGSFHKNDSSDRAFQQCASLALRNEILPKAEVVLMEPWMRLEVETPDEFQGAVTGHLARIRGVVNDIEQRTAACIIRAEAPLAELFNYADDLRSMSKGNATFTMELARFHDCPEAVQSRVLESLKVA